MLIKANQVESDQRIRHPSASPTHAIAKEPERKAELSPLEQTLAEVRAQCAAQSLELTALRTEKAAAYKQGYTEGGAAAALTFERDQSKTLDALQAGFAEAQQNFIQSLKAIDALALLLASEALEKLIGSPDRHRDLMAELIETQLERLDEHSIVALEVAAIDFPDSAERTALEARAKSHNGVLIVNAHWPAGKCLIRLELGTLDIGLDQQWTRLKTLFNALGEGVVE